RQQDWPEPHRHRGGLPPGPQLPPVAGNGGGAASRPARRRHHPAASDIAAPRGEVRVQVEEGRLIGRARVASPRRNAPAATSPHAVAFEARLALGLRRGLATHQSSSNVPSKLSRPFVGSGCNGIAPFGSSTRVPAARLMGVAPLVPGFAWKVMTTRLPPAALL